MSMGEHLVEALRDGGFKT